MVKQVSMTDRLQASVVNVARIHFVIVILLSLQIIVYDAWDLITPDALLGRWATTIMLAIVTVVVWRLAKIITNRSSGVYTALLFGLIMTDIALASYNVYSQRGMASRAVALYAVPIIVSAVMLSRKALFATTALAVAAYMLAAFRYFALHFNEGYKVELYGEVGFYSAIFVVLGGLLWAVIRPKK